MTPLEIYIVCIALNGLIMSCVLVNMNLKRQCLPGKIDISSVFVATLLAPLSLLLYALFGALHGIRRIQNKSKRRKGPRGARDPLEKYGPFTENRE